MTDYKTIVENLIKTVKELGRITFVCIAFFVGVYVGDYSNYNVGALIASISFLSGCLIVLLFILDFLKGDKKDE